MSKLPPGCPDVPALKQRSMFEYDLVKEHTDNRVWIRVKNPGGDTEADIGILVNHEGVSIDVYPAADEFTFSDEPVLQPYALWSDFDEDIGDN